ncbi:sugar ABC transporter ATP-binding protein [Tessaracoccus antarcticus]|uniref:Sugar ABC transporter ATP-binding protein n=1 Tax=Tessaracoccus antarcticus TaxID=2479848 RepID=A0A3M0G9Y7_9ACTN|nr:sugar ABC transporter ATP-binding protein [Tessaracoccus antarcticus]RMB57809.1 sugar ABC transporter ATP-binding protein [Tessaracoccus antarcticus]
MENPGEQPLISLRNAVKTFGPVVALADGSIDLHAGEIHALAGENGAGKSTLVKVLAGLHHRDSGDFEIEGQPVSFATVADSRAAGISVIYQEPTLFPDLTVAENIFIGRQPRGRFGMIDHRLMRDHASAIFEELGVPIDPDRLAEGLSIADQQIIEIAKAISLEARVLVMDEPTAALSGHEVDRLFAVARSLRDKGAALMFISHRMEEIFSLCDRVTVMRDGRYVTTRMIPDTTPSQIVRDMVGRDIDQLFPKFDAQVGAPVLEVEGLNRAGVFRNISFCVRAGEIVALSGLVGAGRSEVARAVMGIDPIDSGTVTLLGKRLKPGQPMAAIRGGMGFVPEDRRKQGLVMELSVLRNTALTLRDGLARFGIINARKEAEVAAEWGRKLQVKSSSPYNSVATLSGGNQQKVVLAKWLATKPKLLIVDEPTRGIDVGTKAEVHRLLSQLAVDGVAILMISSELPEVLGMADRVLVMCEGAITAEFPRAEATPERIIEAATDHAKAAAS